ncbi:MULTISPECIES: hypothetical protein [Aquimarina]|uniref:hypothetical protein n=1 Tax=Aquimarina TaxID=290174 RepID=UPI0003F597AC|nr:MULTISPECIES: hypothetical protein [Aquimarina]
MTDFEITSNDELSNLIIRKGISSWVQLIQFIKDLPYGRNANRIDSKLVILEQKGTCSSKHALLKRVANLNGRNDIDLIIGIYRMNSINTPNIGNILLENNLNYIPEAHTYLRYKNQTIDATSSISDFYKIENDVIVEKNIKPLQVGDFKIHYHQEYIKSWIIEEELNFSFDKIWGIREQCIRNLSQ